MSLKTIIDIPLGEHTGTCTIEVPLAAASTAVNGTTIAAITGELAAVIERATKIKAPTAMQPARVDTSRPSLPTSSAINPAKRRRQDNDGEDDPPTFDPRTISDMPNGLRHISIALTDARRNEPFLKILGTTRMSKLMEAYAIMKGLHVDVLRFYPVCDSWPGDRITGNETANQVSSSYYSGG